MKDTIRRRGENISSFEVENEIFAHPDVREVAAYAVPDLHGGDDVMVAICLIQGAVLEWGDFLNYLSTRMAHFMIPRYIRIVNELPKTSTQKVQKVLLRQEGVTADTFDRVAAGFEFKSSAKLANSAPVSTVVT
jgi:crotonobetaine/carnitine-CoA ligase